MVSTILLFASALLAASNVFSSPILESHSARDILTGVFGPVETWDAIRAIDIHPNGTFDGRPVDDSIIYAYEPPKSAPREKHELAVSLLEARGTKVKREESSTCYQSGTWVLQNQLYSGGSGFCGDLNAAGGIGPGQYHYQFKLYYQATDGSFQRFTSNVGALTTVYYYVKVPSPSTWNYQTCFDLLFEITWRCKGTNPDSAGGSITGFRDAPLLGSLFPGYTGVVDPQE
ncbi:hypothetical protein B0O99DRAFT_643529 [Bisporella sp. PMI_857]|nr:hypothetical protein B0O99DRAFT_643529 [Bisporella sp. PMI_857]